MFSGVRGREWVKRMRTNGLSIYIRRKLSQEVPRCILCILFIQPVSFSFSPSSVGDVGSGGGVGGGVMLSHFSERSNRRDLGQIGILGGNWHFRWE